MHVRPCEATPDFFGFLLRLRVPASRFRQNGMAVVVVGSGGNDNGNPIYAPVSAWIETIEYVSLRGSLAAREMGWGEGIGWFAAKRV